MGEIVNSRPETKIIVVRKFTGAAGRLFNGNAFPDYVAKEIDACLLRLALFLYHSDRLVHEIEEDLTKFLQTLHLHPSLSDLDAAVKSRPDLQLVAYSDGLECMVCFHGVLYSLKSFLDTYAILICRLINPQTQPTTFGRKKINGKELSGAKLALWVRNNAPKSFANTEPLADMIIKHSGQWISLAISYRDVVAHYRDIEGMKHMHVSLKPTEPAFKTSDIVAPTMPDGQKIMDYCGSLFSNLGGFLDETLFLLPKVKHELIERWVSCIR